MSYVRVIRRGLAEGYSFRMARHLNYYNFLVPTTADDPRVITQEQIEDHFKAEHYVDEVGNELYQPEARPE